MFFKHKYITSSTVTPEDAVVQAATQLAHTLSGIVPPPISESGIEKIRRLTSIFSNQDDVAPTEGVHPPRVDMGQEEGQKITTEDLTEEESPGLIVASPPITTKIPDWFDGYEEQITNHQNQHNTITQDDSDDRPAHNTQSTRHSTPTITQEVLLVCIQMTSTTLDPQKMSGRKFPLQLLCKMAGSVLDGTTGDLLEYRH